MALNAINYCRWSTLEQGHDDRSSEVRQNDSNIAMIRAQSWSYAGVPVIDSGRSAYTGENLTKGHLGTLTKKLLSGVINPHDTVLVVEEMDRLSRRPPADMQAWMLPLLAAGLTIAISKTGQIITQHFVNNDMGGYMMIMMSAFSAYGFSQTQSGRVGKSWVKRRHDMAEGLINARHRAPKWILWDALARSFKLDPLRASIIREVFDLHLNGLGKGAIAKLFNERMASDPNYDTWAAGKKKPAIWEATYIGRILHNITVTGYLQFTNHARGATKATPIGKPVKVYPAVIDEDTFNRANDRRFVHQMKHQGKGQNLSNLLGTLARCAKCGGQMTPLGSARIRTNSDGSKSQHYFLYCGTAKKSKLALCDHALGWTCSRIEQPLLDGILNRAMDDQHFTTGDDEVMRVEGEVFRLRRRVDDQTKGAKALAKLVRERPGDEIIAEEYNDAGDELAASKLALDAAYQALSDAKGRVSPSEHVVRVNEMRAKMESDDPAERYKARSMVKAALHGLIESITFDDKKRRATVHIVGDLAVMFIMHDGQSTFFDLHKSGRDDYSHGREADEQATIAGYIRRKGEGA